MGPAESIWRLLLGMDFKMGISIVISQRERKWVFQQTLRKSLLFSRCCCKPVIIPNSTIWMILPPWINYTPSVVISPPHPISAVSVNPYHRLWVSFPNNKWLKIILQLELLCIGQSAALSEVLFGKANPQILRSSHCAPSLFSHLLSLPPFQSLPHTVIKLIR